MPSFGINRYTGAALSDFEHVVQSVEVLFSTQIGWRVMRRQFGSPAPILLGRAMHANNVVRFFYLIYVALEMWEPRLRYVRVRPEGSPEELRLGHMRFFIDVEYRPRAHLNPPDFTPEGVLRAIHVDADKEQLTVRSL